MASSLLPHLHHGFGVRIYTRADGRDGPPRQVPKPNAVLDVPDPRDLRLAAPTHPPIGSVRSGDFPFLTS